MVKRLTYSLFAKHHLRQGIRQLRHLEKKLFSREARFAIPFAYRGKGYYKTIEPRQNPLEIEDLYRTVCDLSPSQVLEVGTARGGTLYLWTQAATAHATIVSVDLPEGDFGGAYPPEKVPFYREFARAGQTLHLLRKDSHDPQTIAEVRSLFVSGPVDFAFIDGDHTYAGVKADFVNYGPLVRPGGLIAFHDILPRPDMPAIQVDKFWAELKTVYQTRELIGTDASGRKIGIGLLYVGDNGIC